MKHEKIAPMLAEILEENVKDTTNLWPRIRAGVPTNSSPRRAPRVGWAVGIALVAMLAIGGVAVALSLVEKATEGDDGINAIYKAGLITPVGQSQTINGVTVTLDWVYADPFRVLVAYSTTTDRADLKPTTSLSEESLLGGLTVQPIGGAGYMGQSHTEVSEIAALDAPDLPPGTDAIDAHLALHVLDQSARLSATDIPPGAPDTPEMKQAQIAQLRDIGTLTFDVQIPLTAGRTFTPDQDATAEVVTMTLARLIVAPSGIRADVCFDAPEGDYVWTIVGDVRGGGQMTGHGGAAAGEIADQPGCFAAFFYEALPLDAGSYTVRITEMIGFDLGNPAAQQNRIAGPWTFEVSGE